MENKEISKPKRNWSEYNKKLCNNGSIILFLSEDFEKKWFYDGNRHHGGKCIYSDTSIELCLLIKEYYGLALRQSTGFIRSIINKICPIDIDLPVPDYTTLSRRCRNLTIDYKVRQTQIDRNKPLVVAIDSTGLTVCSSTQWLAEKHGSNKRSSRDKWRKLHIITDTKTGDILVAEYTHADVNDPLIAPELIEKLEENIKAVCGDKAYDTIKTRKAIKDKRAEQRIPPPKITQKYQLSERRSSLRIYCLSWRSEIRLLNLFEIIP